MQEAYSFYCRPLYFLTNASRWDKYDGAVGGVAPDKRFVYYLMASTGICVVPLSGFNSNLHGFRMTLLETDEVKFRKTLDSVAGAIKKYLAS